MQPVIPFAVATRLKPDHVPPMKANAHPFLEPHAPVDWNDLTAERVVPDMTAALARAEEALTTIESLPADARTFASVVRAYDAAMEELGRSWRLVTHLYSVKDHPALREAYKAIEPEVTAFYTNIPLRPKLWEAFRGLGEKLKDADLLPDERRYLDESIADFKQHGADLPAAQKERLAAIEARLAEATREYSDNALDATNAWELIVDDEERLAGLPERVRAAARRSAKEKGHGTDEAPRWRFTLQMPSYLPVMQYAEDRSLRETLWRAMYTVGTQSPHDNEPLMREILDLRQEQAELLGYRDWADFTTDRRMAKSGASAQRFLDDLAERIRPAFDADVARLEAFRAEQSDQSGHLAPWDGLYWADKLRVAEIGFDEEKLRPWFPLPKVEEGLFRLCEQLFAIRFVHLKGAEKPPVWSPLVEVFRVEDADGTPRGLFYADWYPREEKRSGGWMGDFAVAVSPLGNGDLHAGVICGNLEAPADDAPALLSPGEVLTIFHEVGHLLHLLLGEVRLAGLSGMYSAWDFIELPSQIVENWFWEREILDTFAAHYQTGEPIRNDDFTALQRSRTFLSARGFMRQLLFGQSDLRLHRNWKELRERGQTVQELVDELAAPFAVPLDPPATHNMADFGHLFGSPTGYAAGYYAYKWAEVLEADAFTRFQTEGLRNPATGKALRDTIFAPGNSAPPEELFRNFMGRDPDPEALIRREGITPAAN